MKDGNQSMELFSGNDENGRTDRHKDEKSTKNEIEMIKKLQQFSFILWCYYFVIHIPITVCRGHEDEKAEFLNFLFGVYSVWFVCLTYPLVHAWYLASPFHFKSFKEMTNNCENDNSNKCSNISYHYQSLLTLSISIICYAIIFLVNVYFLTITLWVQGFAIQRINEYKTPYSEIYAIAIVLCYFYIPMFMYLFYVQKQLFTYWRSLHSI